MAPDGEAWSLASVSYGQDSEDLSECLRRQILYSTSLGHTLALALQQCNVMRCN